MGADINIFVEAFKDGAEWVVVKDLEPFVDRNYNVFGFLAGVRNHAHMPVISSPRGLPEDTSISVQEWEEGFGYSWIGVDELASYDYGQVISGGTAALREILPETFFLDLDRLVGLGAPASTRIVFWFDS